MKIKLKLTLGGLALIFLTLHPVNGIAQSIGINETGTLPDNSALLDLSSTNKGFLITRADTANIPSPAFGLMTLAPIDSCLYMYSGDEWISQGGAGYDCPCGIPESNCGPDTETIVNDVTSTNGIVWMDRNLGASQVATSKDDVAAYGDLYQWGRCADGHQKRNSGATPTLSTTDDPGHGSFITSTSDWRDPRNDLLWQGVNGINNPCPIGYRIPTQAEYQAEKDEWGVLNLGSDDAFDSPLKLPVAGGREKDGTMELYPDTRGNYWTSTVHNTTDAIFLHFQNQSVVISFTERATAYSVRCIKD